MFVFPAVNPNGRHASFGASPHANDVATRLHHQTAISNFRIFRLKKKKNFYFPNFNIIPSFVTQIMLNLSVNKSKSIFTTVAKYLVINQLTTFYKPIFNTCLESLLLPLLMLQVTVSFSTGWVTRKTSYSCLVLSHRSELMLPVSQQSMPECDPGSWLF